jgi:hypothetical protein
LHGVLVAGVGLRALLGVDDARPDGEDLVIARHRIGEAERQTLQRNHDAWAHQRRQARDRLALGGVTPAAIGLEVVDVQIAEGQILGGQLRAFPELEVVVAGSVRGAACGEGGCQRQQAEEAQAGGKLAHHRLPGISCPATHAAGSSILARYTQAACRKWSAVDGLIH